MHENPFTFDKGKTRRNDIKICFIFARMVTQSKQITGLMAWCKCQTNQVVGIWLGTLSFITSIFDVSKIKTLGFSLKHYISHIYSLFFLPLRIMTSRQKNDKYLLLTLTKWPLKRLDSLSCSLWQRQIALIIICSTSYLLISTCPVFKEKWYRAKT